MQNLKPELYEPLTQWLDEVMGCETRRPEALSMPDMGWQNKTKHSKSNFDMQRVCIFILEATGQYSPVEGRICVYSFSGPLDCIHLSPPSRGLALLVRLDVSQPEHLDQRLRGLERVCGIQGNGPGSWW